MSKARVEFEVDGHKEVMASLREQERALVDQIRLSKASKEQLAAWRGELVQVRRAQQDMNREMSETRGRASALASQFGIQLPSAMQKFILQSQTAQRAVNLAFNVGVFAAFGAVPDA